MNSLCCLRFGQTLIVWLLKLFKNLMVCEQKILLFHWRSNTIKGINLLYFELIELLVFVIGGNKQNAGSLSTPVSDPAFHDLSHGSLSFALHGSFFNHFLNGQNSSTANQDLWNKWLMELPWRRKCLLPCERALKVGLKTGVKIDFAFCMGPFIEKTKSVWHTPKYSYQSR